MEMQHGKRIILFLLTAACLFSASIARGQEGYTSPLHMTTRGTEMGRYPQLWGSATKLQIWSGSFVASNGAWVHDADSAVTEVFLDADGNILSMVMVNMDVDTVAYRYDSSGRLAATFAISHGDTAQIEEFLYDGTADRVTEILNHADHANSRVTYQYTSQGFCKTIYESSGSPVTQHCFSNHHLTSIISYNTYWAEPDDYLAVLEYDGAGRPTLLGDMLNRDDTTAFKVIEYDPFGNVILWSVEGDTVRNEYRYDLHHNWIEQVHWENDRPYYWERREISYADDSSDFRDARRRFDIFWDDDHVTGYVEVEYPNGDHYIGNLVEGVRQGQGDLYYADGHNYSGYFDQGLYHGYGKLHRYDAEVIANWQHGSTGDGTVDIHYFSGARYTGPLPEPGDSCRYLGRTIYPDGRTYEGEYACEQHDGFGVMRMSDNSRIEGYWENGMLEGEATVVMPNLDRHYVTYLHGERQPYCRVELINGALYEGQTTPEGILTGYGTYTTAKGKSKSGYFIDGVYKGRRKPRVVQ